MLAVSAASCSRPGMVAMRRTASSAEPEADAAIDDEAVRALPDIGGPLAIGRASGQQD